MHLSRWVTSHGFAYNVSTDLRYFDLIVPCGIAGKRATSLEKLLGRRVELKEAAPRIAAPLGELFGLVPRAGSRDAWKSLLRLLKSEAQGRAGWKKELFCYLCASEESLRLKFKKRRRDSPLRSNKKRGK